MRYIPRDQMVEAQTNDPIPAYRQTLLSSGVCTEDELAGVEAAAEEAVNDAVKQVVSAPFPSPDELTAHVYKNPEKMPV
jgi:pyruvate dehydrogenase E1 component alpha subunit